MYVHRRTTYDSLKWKQLKHLSTDERFFKIVIYTYMEYFPKF